MTEQTMNAKILSAAEDFLKDPITTETATKASKWDNKIDDKIDYLEDAINNYITDENTTVETASELQMEMNKIAKRGATVRHKLAERICESENASSMHSSRNYTPTEQTTKLDKLLQPKPLSLDSSLEALEIWITKLKVYFQSGKFEEMLPKTQFGYFANCIDDEITKMVMDRFRKESVNIDDVTVFGNNGYLETVKKIFLTKYPLFTRRRRYFSMRQAGMTALAFLHQVTRMGIEADTKKLDTESLDVFTYINNLDDESLKREIVKLREPTYSNIEKLAALYDEGGLILEDTSKNHQVLQFNSKAKGNYRQKCDRCGSDKHHGSDCWVKVKGISCNMCGKIGHLSSVCRSTTINRSKAIHCEEEELEELEEQENTKPLVMTSISMNGGKPVIQPQVTPRLPIRISHDKGLYFKLAAFPDT